MAVTSIYLFSSLFKYHLKSYLHYGKIHAKLGIVHTLNLNLGISPSDAISIDILPSFQIAIAGNSDNVLCFLACVNTTLVSFSSFKATRLMRILP